MTRPQNLWRVLSVTALMITTHACNTAGVLRHPTRGPVHLGSAGSQLTYVVLGDSTAAGVGAAYADGIAMGTTTDLAKSHQVVMTNLSVSGAQVADVIEDQIPDAERLHPDLVLISVCANDVTHLTNIGSMKKNLLRIIHLLKAANPNVAIVLTGSPDMGAPPRVPRLLRGWAGRRTESVKVMVREVVAAEHLTFAPIAATTGPIFRADHTRFAPDQFHPNARGYAVWIPILNEAIVRALQSRPDQA